MKKIYVKPEADAVAFYSEEEIASVSTEDESISGDIQTVNFFDLGYHWT